MPSEQTILDISGEIITKVQIRVVGDPDLVKKVSDVAAAFKMRTSTGPPDTQPPEPLDEEPKEDELTD